MSRPLLICVMLVASLTIGVAQSVSTTTISGYNESQKRLLAKNIGRFLYVVHQGQWDLDSCVMYACKIYGLNVQSPYNESINSGDLQRELQWLNHHRVQEVLQSLQVAKREKKIELSLQLALYYLHRPGSSKIHIDLAAGQISVAKEIAQQLKLKKWIIECDALMGEVHSQKGDLQKSVATFSAILSSLKQGKDKKRTAIAYHQLGLHLPYNDPKRLRYLETAFADFQQLQLQEHAIEVLSDIVTYYFAFDWVSTAKKLNEVLALQKQSGYRHIMDTYYVMAYLKDLQADYIGSIRDMDSCVAVMTKTGDSSMFSMACFRLGSIYAGLGEFNKAYRWYTTGMDRRYVEPQLFWHKNLEELSYPMIELDKTKEYLALLQNITAEFPPEGKIDSIRLALHSGIAYSKLGEYDKAEKNFQLFLSYFDKIPAEHLQLSEILGYVHYAHLCYRQGNYKLARHYLRKAQKFTMNRSSVISEMNIYSLRYTLDSIEGKYQDAFFNFRKYSDYRDSFLNFAHRFKNEETNVRFETAKKDKDIQILQQQRFIHERDLRQAKQTRNLVLGGSVLLLVIGALGYNQYRLKQKSLRVIGHKNAELQQLVNEKEWLLKEVHHRVKNNLQTIVSLLELQAAHLSDNALSAIQVSQNRIFATSLLHQKLYQFENVSSVNMRNYLPELIQHLQEVFDVRYKISFQISISEIELDVSQAMPLALIVNEALSNAIKYAFPGKESASSIKLSYSLQENGFAALLITDNGKGFATTEDTNVNGLGLNLIRGLARDIDGEAMIESGDDGTRVRVVFRLRSLLPVVQDQEKLSTVSA